MLLNFNFFIFYFIYLYFYSLNKNINNIFKLYLLSVSFFFLFFLKTLNFFKKNNYENDFWYLIEVLNNNNNSVLLFIYLMIIVFYIKNFSCNFFIKNTVYYYYIFLAILVFLYDNNYLIYYNHITYLDKINFNLINGVVLIHPILVYYTYILFLIFFFKKSIKINNINSVIIKVKFEILYVSLLGLFLGGYWAQQELNWGGWWNWDFVEIIALIFNVLALYLVHSNFYKNYNNVYIIYKNIWYYLFCFFFFVRVDILNSIHSFNSIAISNNYRFILYFFVLFLLIFIVIFNYIYFYKYKQNKVNIDLISVFFKLVNSIFLFYFLINLFFILYLNYQFLDITKYIKIILLLLVYLYILILFINKKYFLMFSVVSVLLKIKFFFNWVVLFVLVNLLFLTKNSLKSVYNNNAFIKIFFHFSFFIFIVSIQYNFNQIYNHYIYGFSFFKVLLNNDYIIINYHYNSIVSYFNNFNIILNNFSLINNKNSFYYLDSIFVNNLIKDNFLMVIYNLDTSIYLTLYDNHLLYFIILLVSVLMFIY